MEKLILFDNNGVLTASDKENTYYVCSNFLGVSESKLKDSFLKFAPVLDKGEITQDEFYNQVLRFLNLDVNDKILVDFRRVHLSAYTRKEEMLDLALKLKKNFKLALLTNFGDAFDEVNEKLWKLNKIFLNGMTFVSSKIGMAKPEKEIYSYVLKKTGFEEKPENVIFIDDNLDNVNSAKSLGIDAILFEGKIALLKELSKRGIKH